MLIICEKHNIAINCIKSLYQPQDHVRKTPIWKNPLRPVPYLGNLLPMAALQWPCPTGADQGGRAAQHPKLYQDGIRQWDPELGHGPGCQRLDVLCQQQWPFTIRW